MIFIATPQPRTQPRGGLVSFAGLSARQGKDQIGHCQNTTLTYMSIRDVIARHEETELFAVRSSWEPGETARSVYVSYEVAQFLWAASGVRDARLAGRCRAVVDDFIEGGIITIGWDPYAKGASCIMARVASPAAEYELWDFRCLDPRPGARLLGGFAERDVFVILTWDYRENFDNHWPEQIGRCIDEWRRLFGALIPLRASTADEYVSQPWTIV